jgi:hypothetical protein
MPVCITARRLVNSTTSATPVSASSASSRSDDGTSPDLRRFYPHHIRNWRGSSLSRKLSGGLHFLIDRREAGIESGNTNGLRDPRKNTRDFRRGTARILTVSAAGPSPERRRPARGHPRAGGSTCCAGGAPLTTSATICALPLGLVGWGHAPSRAIPAGPLRAWPLGWLLGSVALASAGLPIDPRTARLVGPLGREAGLRPYCILSARRDDRSLRQRALRRSL